jgi:2-(1,2-epoxy-1,2-dihydrophenyl)acetyl-CoA isomerase
MKTYSTIKFELHSNFAVITINRPEAANGINLLMASELASIALDCDNNKTIKAVLLTAQGKFFSAGGDVKSMSSGENLALEIKRMADELHRAISTFQRMPAPLIVAVNGVCAGAGLSLAASGDLVLAAESAKFTMAYTNIGLSPDGSSSYFLPRLIGLRKTQELMFTNRTLLSSEAQAWGLVTRVCPDSSLLGDAMKLTQDIAAGHLQAHGAIKNLLSTTFNNGLETQMELEGRFIAACAATENGQEGIRSFIEKRKPKFS